MDFKFIVSKAEKKEKRSGFSGILIPWFLIGSRSFLKLFACLPFQWIPLRVLLVSQDWVFQVVFLRLRMLDLFFGFSKDHWLVFLSVWMLDFLVLLQDIGFKKLEVDWYWIFFSVLQWYWIFGFSFNCVDCVSINFRYKSITACHTAQEQNFLILYCQFLPKTT